MSEQQQPNETTQVVNNELTDRVNNAYLANNYTLLNGGTDNVVMIKGDKDDKSVDVLLTLEGMEEVSKTLRAEVDGKPKEKTDGDEE
jgi:hypothetical protein